MSTATGILEDIATQVDEALAGMWAVLVHNDDVTTFDTVITALMHLFERTQEEAEMLAWQVHTQGKAVVAVLPEAEAALGVRGLHGYRIQASAEPA